MSMPDDMISSVEVECLHFPTETVQWQLNVITTSCRMEMTVAWCKHFHFWCSAVHTLMSDDISFEIHSQFIQKPIWKPSPYLRYHLTDFDEIWQADAEPVSSTQQPLKKYRIVNYRWWRRSVSCGGPICVTMPDFIKIHWTVALIWQFCSFPKWRLSTVLDFWN